MGHGCIGSRECGVVVHCVVRYKATSPSREAVRGPVGGGVALQVDVLLLLVEDVGHKYVVDVRRRHDFVAWGDGARGGGSGGGGSEEMRGAGMFTTAVVIGFKQCDCAPPRPASTAAAPAPVASKWSQTLKSQMNEPFSNGL